MQAAMKTYRNHGRELAAELMEELPMLEYLREPVRNLACVIAESMEPGAAPTASVMSSAIGIARDVLSGRFHDQLGGSAVVVEEENNMWAVRRIDEEEPIATFSRRDDAVRRGLDLASRYDVDFVVFGPRRSLIERHPRQKIRAPWLDLIISNYDPKRMERTTREQGGRLELVKPEQPEVSRPMRDDGATKRDATPIITIAKDKRKWVLTMPNGDTESFRTKREAMATAKEMAKSIGADIDA